MVRIFVSFRCDFGDVSGEKRTHLLARCTKAPCFSGSNRGLEVLSRAAQVAAWRRRTCEQALWFVRKSCNSKWSVHIIKDVASWRRLRALLDAFVVKTWSAVVNDEINYFSTLSVCVLAGRHSECSQYCCTFCKELFELQLFAFFQLHLYHKCLPSRLSWNATMFNWSSFVTMLSLFWRIRLHSKRGDIFYLILLRTYVAIAQHAELGINL